MSEICDYCTEDMNGDVSMFGAFYITEDSFSGKYFINTRHCKPREIFFCPKCGRKLSEDGSA